MTATRTRGCYVAARCPAPLLGGDHTLWHSNHEAAMKSPLTKKSKKPFAQAVGAALRRAAKTVRKTARAYGTPVYFIRDGKIVAEKP